MSEEKTVAVNVVPGRTGGAVSLHIGPSWVILTIDDAQNLALDIASTILGQRVVGFNIGDNHDNP